MILADTSVWVDHFRSPSAAMRTLLVSRQLLTHRMVIAELACGQLPERRSTLALLHLLPRLEELPDAEVLGTIERKRWWGLGIGWVDAHLAAASLTAGIPLWTLDRRLSRLLHG
ncbi:MAG: type II toxin-antitoxin system VapC family toxin [Terriglobales bacterium]